MKSPSQARVFEHFAVPHMVVLFGEVEELWGREPAAQKWVAEREP